MEITWKIKRGEPHIVEPSPCWECKKKNKKGCAKGCNNFKWWMSAVWPVVTGRVKREEG